MGANSLGSYLKTVAVWVGLLAVTYVFWKWYIGYVLPFVLALVIAASLEPLVVWLERRGVAPIFAVLASLLVGVGGTLVVIGFLLTVLLSELFQLTRSLPHYVMQWQGLLDRYVVRLGELRQTLGISQASLHAQLGAVYQVLESMLKGVLTFFVRLPDMVLMIVVALVAAFFILRDRARVAQGARSLLPPGMRPHVGRIKVDIVNGILGFLKAQLALMGLTAAATALGLTLIGARYAVLLGLVAGLLDLVPFMGPTGLLLPWAVVAMLTGHLLMSLKLFTVLTGVALVRQLVEPRLVGDNTGLHPLVALFSLYVGIRLFGASGFFVGPISAVILKAVNRAMLLSTRSES